MKRCSIDALVNTVNLTWTDDSLDKSIKNVFLRLEKVICLINEGEGANDLVETKRGPKNNGMKFDFAQNLRKIMKTTQDYLTEDRLNNQIDGNEIMFDDQNI